MIPTICDTCGGTGILEPDDAADTYYLGGICGDCPIEDEPAMHCLPILSPTHNEGTIAGLANGG